MRKSRFSEEQTVKMVRECGHTSAVVLRWLADAGIDTDHNCSSHALAERQE